LGNELGKITTFQIFRKVKIEGKGIPTLEREDILACIEYTP